jgi:predicted SprT family Zn-dependent metalloprotease
MVLHGDLADDHDLSAWGRRYANRVVAGDRWPIGPPDVELARVTWGVSARAKRRHATTRYDPDGRCRVLLAAKTLRKAGREPLRETVRHELVHVHQHQHADDPDVQRGHGPSFQDWVDPLELQGTTASHYEPVATDYDYRVRCVGCGALVAGRYRLCPTVREAHAGRLRCGECGGRLRVRTDDPDDEFGDVPSATTG